MKWEVLEEKSSPSSSTASSVHVTFRLSANEASKKIWPHEFETLYTVTLTGSKASSLRCDWSVQNTSKDEAFTFTAALHSYFTVGDIRQAGVGSLTGVRYIDQLKKGQEFVEGSDRVSFSSELDRIYQATPNTLPVHDTSLSRSIVLKKEGLPDAVVWNPWVDKSKAMADFGDNEFNTMLCVEPAVIEKPIQLAAGASWSSLLEMHVEPLAPKPTSQL